MATIQFSVLSQALVAELVAVEPHLIMEVLEALAVALGKQVAMASRILAELELLIRDLLVVLLVAQVQVVVVVVHRR
jgi:hypothetical protein